jgi:hypothetical protein
VDPSVAGSLAALGQFEQLPNVTNTWQQFMVDLEISFRRVGSPWGKLPELDISDFATIDTNGSVGFTPATGNPGSTAWEPDHRLWQPAV